MSKEKLLRRPIIDPLILALKSRRVIVALSALLVGLLVLAVPELKALRGEILTLVITLALAVIGGYTVEEAARAGRERSNLPQEELRELIKDVLGGVIDELTNEILAKQDVRHITQPEERNHVST
jgi:hypothetical protein